MLDLKNLVVVPGHAVYTGSAVSDVTNDECWLGRFGYTGEAILYAEHIRAGVNRAAVDKDSLLVFSGGQTRREAGRRSEAAGYRSVAEQNDWFGHPTLTQRTAEECYARDSFENLEFSTLLFGELTGRKPSLVRVCGFGFKRARFQLHASELKLDAFEYNAVNDPPPHVLNGGSLAGEERTRQLFERTPRGDSGELLQKRLERDPFKRGTPYK